MALKEVLQQALSRNKFHEKQALWEERHRQDHGSRTSVSLKSHDGSVVRQVARVPNGAEVTANAINNFEKERERNAAVKEDAFLTRFCNGKDAAWRPDLFFSDQLGESDVPWPLRPTDFFTNPGLVHRVLTRVEKEKKRKKKEKKKEKGSDKEKKSKHKKEKREKDKKAKGKKEKAEKHKKDKGASKNKKDKNKDKAKDKGKSKKSRTQEKPDTSSSSSESDQETVEVDYRPAPPLLHLREQAGGSCGSFKGSGSPVSTSAAQADAEEAEVLSDSESSQSGASGEREDGEDGEDGKDAEHLSEADYGGDSSEPEELSAPAPRQAARERGRQDPGRQHLSQRLPGDWLMS